MLELYTHTPCFLNSIASHGSSSIGQLHVVTVTKPCKHSFNAVDCQCCGHSCVRRNQGFGMRLEFLGIRVFGFG